MENQTRRTILVAGIGLSSAVLTNTVWALAREETPVLPDEVVAVTTRSGRKCIETQLLDSGAWRRLCGLLESKGLQVAGKLAFGASDSIRVIGDGKSDFDDIATPYPRNLPRLQP